MVLKSQSYYNSLNNPNLLRTVNLALPFVEAHPLHPHHSQLKLSSIEQPVRYSLSTNPNNLPDKVHHLVCGYNIGSCRDRRRTGPHRWGQPGQAIIHVNRDEGSSGYWTFSVGELGRPDGIDMNPCLEKPMQ